MTPPSASGAAGSIVLHTPDTPGTPAQRHVFRRPIRLALAHPALAAVLCLALVAGVAVGTVAVPPGVVLGVIARHLGVDVVQQTWTAAQDAIVWQVRLPRVLAAALVGAALATSGALFQGLFRNPMADPYVLGISSGAAFGATLALSLSSGAGLGAGLGVAMTAGPAGLIGPALLIPVCAFVGALGAAALVYVIARHGSALPVTDLLLAGLAVAAVLGAGTIMLLVLNDRLLLRLRTVFTFLAGGITAGGWASLGTVAPLIGVGLLLALLLARWLDAFQLGEEGAAYVGVPVERAKALTVLVAALLAASAVVLGGLIGFVGLLAPHALRLTLGPSHRTLLPAAMLGGAALLVLSDVLARTVIAPTELPVGVLTALIGGPAFLALLKRSRRSEGGGA
ncbi:MAG: Vitamin B12 ABC transporter, permease protein BtuC [uncultured Chloroflexi bacterium]|uniref:Vitamin B12 ABC transporter, permease protein BtuC n=1 Tax=uncultured Chloroflexota bacterium TaxID=166587 RepID=A0A6J4JH21_9CHLR|nr:MAG: Vitamin B12 ABC transporter, permease protein BtuC [uncultured Chloroflexota bacterium]